MNASSLSGHRASLLVALELIGSGCGILGALLMAINPGEFAAIAFPIWLISSLLLSVFAYLSRLKYLLGLQLTFTVINVMGVAANTIG